ncbi:hypothetical protein OSTOST_09089 [Ostertagia ostertagi]
MFVSQPQYEFPFPPGLEQPGSQHWRMVELTLHAPWFLLSVEVLDADIRDCSMTRTICIAWDYDLAEVLRGLDADCILGIVCMMPAWASPNGQWSSREVREVWMCTSDAGQSVLLLDAAGQEFDCGLVPEHVEPIKKDLAAQQRQVFRRRHDAPDADVRAVALQHRGQRAQRAHHVALAVDLELHPQPLRQRADAGQGLVEPADESRPLGRARRDAHGDLFVRGVVAGDAGQRQLGHAQVDVGDARGAQRGGQHVVGAEEAALGTLQPHPGELVRDGAVRAGHGRQAQVDAAGQQCLVDEAAPLRQRHRRAGARGAHHQPGGVVAFAGLQAAVHARHHRADRLTALEDAGRQPAHARPVGQFALLEAVQRVGQLARPGVQRLGVHARHHDGEVRAVQPRDGAAGFVQPQRARAQQRGHLLEQLVRTLSAGALIQAGEVVDAQQHHAADGFLVGVMQQRGQAVHELRARRQAGDRVDRDLGVQHAQAVVAVVELRLDARQRDVDDARHRRPLDGTVLHALGDAALPCGVQLRHQRLATAQPPARDEQQRHAGGHGRHAVDDEQPAELGRRQRAVQQPEVAYGGQREAASHGPSRTLRGAAYAHASPPAAICSYCGPKRSSRFSATSEAAVTRLTSSLCSARCALSPASMDAATCVASASTGASVPDAGSASR